MDKKPVSQPAVSAFAYLKLLKLSGVDELLLSPETVPTARKAALDSPQREFSEATDSKANRKQHLLEMANAVRGCAKCVELAKTRTQTVFGSGNAYAKLVFVGEAPGFDEDREGYPFVGKAGQLLTKMIEAIGMTRREVFICNILKCRPPQNRNPEPDEMANCSPYLWAQLEMIQPKVVCALGKFAAQSLLQTTKPISQLRGNIHTVRGFSLICTFHPAYLLRNPSDKKLAWEDLKRVRDRVQLPD